MSQEPQGTGDAGKPSDDKGAHSSVQGCCMSSRFALNTPASSRKRAEPDADAECAEVLSPPNKQQRRRVEGISLHVKWQIGSSKTRVHCLNLQRVAGAEDLKVGPCGSVNSQEFQYHWSVQNTLLAACYWLCCF